MKLELFDERLDVASRARWRCDSRCVRSLSQLFALLAANNRRATLKVGERNGEPLAVENVQRARIVVEQHDAKMRIICAHFLVERAPSAEMLALKQIESYDKQQQKIATNFETIILLARFVRLSDELRILFLGSVERCALKLENSRLKY